MTGADHRPVMAAITARRVTRRFADDRLDRTVLAELIKAARWAPSAGNSRLHKFVVADDPSDLDAVDLVSPGMERPPPALIAVCTDLQACEDQGVEVDIDSTVLVDVGTAAMNILLAAHEMGIGACPTTSFSRSGVAAALRLPDRLRPEMLLQLGHPAPTETGTHRSTRLSVDDLTIWASD